MRKVKLFAYVIQPDSDKDDRVFIVMDTNLQSAYEKITKKYPGIKLNGKPTVMHADGVITLRTGAPFENTGVFKFPGTGEPEASPT